MFGRRFSIKFAVFAMFLAILSPIAEAVSCNCKNAFSVDNACYCDAAGAAIWSCIHAQAPYWPMQNAPAESAMASCPDPTVDSAAFDKCIQDQQQKPLPDADGMARTCVTSTKAAPTSSAARTAGIAGGATVLAASFAVFVSAM
ncbi:hypothetical protein DFJ77DRAFT_514712 [Powellomyces hirtus]|nr:hypothetical protein DFJ77DRAFT_514712 [Powellomyces hirtus]